jgi:hypothetical protein
MAESLVYYYLAPCEMDKEHAYLDVKRKKKKHTPPEPPRNFELLLDDEADDGPRVLARLYLTMCRCVGLGR